MGEFAINIRNELNSILGLWYSDAVQLLYGLYHWNLNLFYRYVRLVIDLLCDLLQADFEFP